VIHLDFKKKIVYLEKEKTKKKQPQCCRSVSKKKRIPPHALRIRLLLFFFFFSDSEKKKKENKKDTKKMKRYRYLLATLLVVTTFVCLTEAQDHRTCASDYTSRVWHDGHCTRYKGCDCSLYWDANEGVLKIISREPPHNPPITSNYSETRYLEICTRCPAFATQQIDESIQSGNASQIWGESPVSLASFLPALTINWPLLKCCVCNYGWDGMPYCNLTDYCQLAGGSDLRCSRHGTCVNLANTSSCECWAGYRGNDCSIRVGPPWIPGPPKQCSPGCGNGGSCATNGSCVCLPGFSGLACQLGPYGQSLPLFPPVWPQWFEGGGEGNNNNGNGGGGGSGGQPAPYHPSSPPPPLQYAPKPLCTQNTCDGAGSRCLLAYSYDEKSGGKFVPEPMAACQCGQGRYGTACKSVGPDCSSSSECGSKGVCSAFGPPEDQHHKCKCTTARTGPECQFSGYACVNNPCASVFHLDGSIGRADCLYVPVGKQTPNVTVIPRCVCPPGYTGEFCEIDLGGPWYSPPACPGTDKWGGYCSNGGRCVERKPGKPNSGRCECPMGFTGEACQEMFVPQSACVTANSKHAPCSHQCAFIGPPANSYSCVCPPDQKLAKDGVTCITDPHHDDDCCNDDNDDDDNNTDDGGSDDQNNDNNDNNNNNNNNNNDDEQNALLITMVSLTSFLVLLALAVIAVACCFLNADTFRSFARNRSGNDAFPSQNIQTYGFRTVARV
jgi:hypothetical protein